MFAEFLAHRLHNVQLNLQAITLQETSPAKRGAKQDIQRILLQVGVCDHGGCSQSSWIGDVELALGCG